VDKIHINKISELNRDKLINFYQKSFNFKNSVLINYEWRYRSGFCNYEPLALTVDNQICGHAGLIPVKLKLNEKVETAIWFTDFFINPVYRSRGYGKLLTEAWMKICPNQITLCNNKSLRIFKKLKWSYNNNFVKKIKFYNFHRILPILRKNNQLEISFDSLGELKLEEQNIKTIKDITLIEQKNLAKKKIGIVRDESWFIWRILECPYKKNIFIFSYKNNYFIVNVKIKNNLKILNLIYSSLTVEDELLKILNPFVKKNKIDYLNYISREKKINFNMPWKKKINFAFFSSEKFIMNDIENDLDDIQYIDSDMDYL
tara:strand:- start:1302 stop:2249 length:948 start_codon:yes stop_codon:yes gene_type:complete